MLKEKSRDDKHVDLILKLETENKQIDMIDA
jgi:hypothetical protein